jgi:glycosyltransferase involved in cell wall biosynthesis
MEIASQVSDEFTRSESEVYDWPSEVSPEEVTIVIPTLNEEKGVKVVIDLIRKANFNNIIVVDGGSLDKTATIARSLGVITILQHGKGKTDAIDAAMAFVKTRYLGLIDADNTYDPADFHKMLLYAKSADMVVGSRMRRQSNGLPFVYGHGIVNRVFNRLFNMVYDSHLTDILSGIRIISMDMLKGIRLRSRGFAVEAELSAQILSEGGKIVEVPAHFGRRIGEAKLRYRDGFHILAALLRLAYEFNPMLFFFPIGAIMLLPGLAILTYVVYSAILVNNGIYHSGLALAGIALTFVGIQVVSIGILSFLMKRIEFRQLRAIRQIKSAFSVSGPA